MHAEAQSGLEKSDGNTTSREHPVLAAFGEAAQRVPAYGRILADAGVEADEIRTLADFQSRVPVIDKHATFQRFPLAELCLDGEPGELGGVLTSSGHSGVFAFGLYDRVGAEMETARTDEALDMIFAVKSHKTLLINCLPMGVKVYTRACTVGETSVRADMATALVKQFGPHYEQIVLVGDAAFLKHVIELGAEEGIDWPGLLVHAIIGEEPLAENARSYLEGLLGIDPGDPRTGLIGSSMGVAELGLNLFFELPPLVAVRRALHNNPALRRQLLGPDAPCTPMVFAYDPRRIFVESDAGGELIFSTLDPQRRVPLIRYAPGDVGQVVSDPRLLAAASAAMEMKLDLPADLPIVLVFGRGHYATAGDKKVFPEQVKEGIYLIPELARKTTANFRLASGDDAVRLRVQLAPGVEPAPGLAEQFAEAVARYVTAPLRVTCQRYEDFADGMALDYERKFAYIDPPPQI